MNENNVETSTTTQEVQNIEEQKPVEVKKKNKVLPIILVIVLLIAVGAGCYFLGGYLKVCTSDCKSATISKESSTAKVDEEKEYVYTAESKEYDLTDEEAKYYTTNKIIYNLPVINLDSNYVTNVNESIKEVYDYLISENEKSSEFLGYQYIEANIFDYKFYVNGDILSLVVQESVTEDGGPGYYIYNINIKTGVAATESEILEAANISSNDFDLSAIITKIYNAQDNSYCDDDFMEIYKSQELMQETSLQNAGYYINEDGEIMINVYLPVCAGQGIHSYLFNIDGTKATLFNILKED